VVIVMKMLLLLVGVSLLASDENLRAAYEPEKRTNREDADKRKENWKKLSPEEREAKRKEIKARLESRIVELRSKQTNTTITASETRELVRSEQILKRFEQNSAAAKTDRPKANEPATPPDK